MRCRWSRSSVAVRGIGRNKRRASEEESGGAGDRFLDGLENDTSRVTDIGCLGSTTVVKPAAFTFEIQ